MKQYRMSIERLEAVYRQRRYGSDPGEITVADMEATDEVRDGETFGAYFDRHCDVIDLYEEVGA